MNLKSMMTEGVTVIRSEASIYEAAQLMRDRNIGSLPVCENDRLVGMITDRDLVIRALCQSMDALSTQVKDVMSTPIVYCFEDQEPQEIARIMEAKKIRRVVVLDRDKRLVGIASLDDLAESQALAGEIMAELTHSIHGKVA